MSWFCKEEEPCSHSFDETTIKEEFGWMEHTSRYSKVSSFTYVKRTSGFCRHCSVNFMRLLTLPSEFESEIKEPKPKAD